MNSEIIPDFDKKINPTKRQLLILENIRKCSKITDYLSYRLNKDTTKRNFATHIRDYFVHLDISDVDGYFKDPRRMSNGKKLDYTDKIEQDIQSFNKSFKSHSGSYRLSNLSAIRKLFEFNKIDLGNSFWEGVRKAGANPERETEIETPTKEQLRNILSRADNEGKAFFLMQMSSGSRIEEIRTLTFDNLNIETDPPSFRVTKEHSKTGRATTKFFSYEALGYLKEYLDKDRDRILETRINRARNQKSKDDYENKVFPMGKTNAEIIWNNLCKKEGLYKLDSKTKHPTMGTHSLRRFFEDNIGHGKLSKYMLNKLSKSEEPYSFKTKNKLEELYKKHMDNLYIFETPKKTKEQIEKLQEDLSTKDEEIKRLKEGMEFIDKGRKSYEEQTKHFEDRFKRIEKNLNISLNPNTPQTQNQINVVKGMIPAVFKFKYDRDPKDEELKKMLEQFDNILPGVLEAYRNMPLEEIEKNVTIGNLPNIVDIANKKKKTKNNKNNRKF